MEKEIVKIKDTLEFQLKKTDDVIASNEAVAGVISRVGNTLTEISGNLSEIPNAISEVSYAVDSGFSELAYGLQELCFVMESGFMEIADRIALQNETLKEIKEILERPLDIQAKELRKRAEFAYLNNWINEAETDLLEAEKKNYQDFIVHQILGNIYFYHKKNYPKAIEYYQKAAKYASPVFKKHASNAFVCMSMIYYKLNQVSGAYDATEKALNISPNDSHVLYHHARYSAKMGNEFISFLKKSIYEDSHYLITANMDEGFLKVRKQIKKLAKELRDEEKIAVDKILGQINGLKKEAEETKIGDIQALNEQLAEVKKLYPHNRNFNFQKDFIEPKNAAQGLYEKKLPQLMSFPNNQLTEIKRLYFLNSYFDFIEAKKIAQKTFLNYQKYFYEAKNAAQSVYVDSLFKVMTNKEQNLSVLKNKENKIKNSRLDIWDIFVFIGLFLLFAVYLKYSEFSAGLGELVFTALMLSAMVSYLISLLTRPLKRSIKLYKLRTKIKKTNNIISKLYKIKIIMAQNIQNRDEGAN